MKKKGISLMVSYVFIIIIAISLSIGVYVWLRKISNITPTPECPDEVSLILENYTCSDSEKKITVTLRNKGFFNLDGYDMIGAKSLDGKFIYDFEDSSGLIENGRFFFEGGPLVPGNLFTHKFTYKVGLDTLKKIEITPIRIQDEYVAVCEKSRIIQEVDCS